MPNPCFRLYRKLYLASASPRRRAFLTGLGLDYQVLSYADCEPKPEPGEIPLSYALRSARIKAEQAALEHSGLDGVILAADTIVVLADQRILGKPGSPDEALSMLRLLSGQRHTVYTACCLRLEQGQTVEFYDETAVWFALWPEDVLRAYAWCGEALDKAGAYGIQEQGSFLVERIEGSWSNVVGLPVSKLVAVLVEQGIICPQASGAV